MPGTIYPDHTIPSHTRPYHTISYHPIPDHTIPDHTIPFHTIPYHTMPQPPPHRNHAALACPCALELLRDSEPRTRPALTLVLVACAVCAACPSSATVFTVSAVNRGASPKDAAPPPACSADLLSTRPLSGAPPVSAPPLPCPAGSPSPSLLTGAQPLGAPPPPPSPGGSLSLRPLVGAATVGAEGATAVAAGAANGKNKADALRLSGAISRANGCFVSEEENALAFLLLLVCVASLSTADEEARELVCICSSHRITHGTGTRESR